MITNVFELQINSESEREIRWQRLTHKRPNLCRLLLTKKYKQTYRHKTLQKSLIASIDAIPLLNTSLVVAIVGLDGIMKFILRFCSTTRKNKPDQCFPSIDSSQRNHLNLGLSIRWRAQWQLSINQVVGAVFLLGLARRSPKKLLCSRFDVGLSDHLSSSIRWKWEIHMASSCSRNKPAGGCKCCFFTWQFNYVTVSFNGSEQT